MDDANHYEALGVPVGAPEAEIRRAYLGAARRHHPDFHVAADARTRADHARRMQRVNDAWAVLGDTAARSRYDLTLRTGGHHGGRVRTRPERAAPPGKGWTPRRGDDRWQQDFRAWAAEDDRLADDVAPEDPHRGPLAVLPVAVFAAAVAAGSLGAVLGSRLLLAVAAVAVAVSAAGFVALPVVVMARHRDRDRSRREPAGRRRG